TQADGERPARAEQPGSGYALLVLGAARPVPAHEHATWADRARHVNLARATPIPRGDGFPVNAAAGRARHVPDGTELASGVRWPQQTRGVAVALCRAQGCSANPFSEGWRATRMQHRATRCNKIPV